ncbi:OprD family outer membrane porin [Vibrio marisflavi]|uniref:Chitoporin n=1 Tax=Vibrio marisflavi CECT 7928 TaxID=634439 RepID=A0ABN8E162_9VIBR|nr:OprD family outer membrane porin [Vibrio marisflavi]CAH0536495.1 Chitoporin [Vibrio marisflavi CECT 7928]
MSIRNNIFIRTTLASTILSVISGIGLAYSSNAQAEEAVQESVSTATNGYSSFIDDSKITGGFYVWYRDRDRKDAPDGDYQTNLSHTTLNANIDAQSGYINGIIGADFAAFYAADAANDGDPHHEMAFFPGQDNPWDTTQSASSAKSGASIYKANIKFNAADVHGVVGYYQPTGPGVLGVNWSFMPGTYQGAELSTKIGQWEMAVNYADEYKAPWFQNTYQFRKNDGTTIVDYLYSVGAKYNFTPLTSLEVAYGASEDYLENAHIKAKHTIEYQDSSSLYLTYQLYMMDDSDNSGGVNDNFEGMAFQSYLAAHYKTGMYTFKAEGLHTTARQDNSNQVGYFAYRLTSQYGGSNGAYEPWWDARSDWNQNEETALYTGVWREFSDLGVPGLSSGVSYVYGFGGKAYSKPSAELIETAWNFDLGYVIQEGWFKGTAAKLHYTLYDNRSGEGSWGTFKNAFQDERDLKLTLTVPFDLK